ncbi:MAG: hypothetical protein KDA87_03820 [Planctomycetales bacterium]|nr:hypothetical protein [Planctomycetales bacterium]
MSLENQAFQADTEWECTHNDFVTSEAKLPGSLTESLDTTWTAIAAFPTVNARENTHTDFDGGFPIFRVDGETKIADDYADLWQQRTAIQNGISTTQFNEVTESYVVYTGMSHRGEICVNVDGALCSLDGGGLVAVGRNDHRTEDWTGYWLVMTNELYSVYAMSGILTVGGITGDFDENQVRDVSDIDHLANAVRTTEADSRFDINGDGVVSLEDHRVLIEEVIGTSFGDSDLNGVFDSRDFISVFQTGHYEDGIAANSTWATGDWNGDGEFDSADFIAAFKSGAYESDRGVVALPEPCTRIVAIFLLLGHCVLSRKRFRRIPGH